MQDNEANHRVVAFTSDRNIEHGLRLMPSRIRACRKALENLEAYLAEFGEQQENDAPKRPSPP